MARLHREAPAIDLRPKAAESAVAIEETVVSGEEQEDDTSSGALVMLTRLPLNGFSHSILRKRLLQWRRMGIDVSELEPGLFIDDMNSCHDLYQLIEHKVRRAVELDSRLELVAENVSTAELVKIRFRLRQLTGLDDIEQALELIIEQINL
jgi:hypothetical protein